MNYNEILEQANKLEAQANALREQAERAKAEAAKIDAQKVDSARTELINALLAYMQTICTKPMDRDDAEMLVQALDETFKQIEREYKVLDRLFKDMKVNVNGKELSDDEKIAAFLKAISK